MFGFEILLFALAGYIVGYWHRPNYYDQGFIIPIDAEQKPTSQSEEEMIAAENRMFNSTMRDILPMPYQRHPLSTDNQINVITPYCDNGVWVFDDPARGLTKEALVAGMPEMILAATRAFGIQNPEEGFTVVFSKDTFPDAKLKLEWVRQEGGGNVYRWPDANIEGWLCPALFRYFSEAPKQMYIQLKEVA